MSNKSLNITVPGKLAIAGEYAVLEPHQKLIVMAVNRFVHTQIKTSSENKLSFKNFDLHDVHWLFHDGSLTIEGNDPRFRFVSEAMRVALTFLKEQSIPFENFSLTIKSHLEDESGIKYGLGSSAAVVTSVVTSILAKYYDAKPDKNLIFKLSAIAHVNVQGNGSGFDIAASTYGGMLEYASFQAEWLLEAYKQANSLSELVFKKWPYLAIRQVKLPDSVRVYIGWTGNPASTSELVSRLLLLKTDNPQQFNQFLEDSRKAVDIYLQGLKRNDVSYILEGIRLNRHVLNRVGDQAGVHIETELLTKLCDIAEKHSGAGKPSGAGGGDCGVAFFSAEQNVNELFQEWEAAGIKPLDINICSSGIVIERSEN